MDSSESLVRLLDQLLEADREHEWVEFKTNLSDSNAIGIYLSALANSAALCEVPFGFLIWGISDETHEVVGTVFDPQTAKVGNQALIPWLHAGIAPEVMLQFHSIQYRSQRIVILRVGSARSNPVRFQKTAFIRIDSHNVELSRHPAYEQRLWSLLLQEPEDQAVAMSNLTETQVVEILDTDVYYQRFSTTMPTQRSVILTRLQQHRFIKRQQDGLWEVRTHGALLFGRNLNDFDRLRRKAIRIIHYAGESRIETIREFQDTRGYAVAFDNVHQRVMDLLPSRERIIGARRVSDTMLPSLAIREVLANALIHQDLTIRGSGPVVEIFTSRVEITNPGVPLVDINRMIDAPPQSRNETLASIMRELDFCEERGSGWDKIAFEVGTHFLPAPAIDIAGAQTRIALFGQQPFSQISKEERAWTTYIHACLLYCQREYLTNMRVRERFGIEARNSATASRIISDTVEAGWLIPYDPNASKKMRQYVPYWAGRNP